MLSVQMLMSVHWVSMTVMLMQLVSILRVLISVRARKATLATVKLFANALVLKNVFTDTALAHPITK